MKQASSNNDRDAALACAEAFLRLAEPVVIRIGKDMEESTKSHPFLPSMGDVAAAATNLAFAIELYIKAILITSKTDKHGHDLGKLYAAMPRHFKDVIENSYEETRKKDWNGRYPSITVAMRPVPANLPKWNDNCSEPLDLGALLNRSSDIFTSWRYIYEFKNADKGGWQSHCFEYGLLLSACRAMRDTIKSLQNPPADSEM
ncbi:MAG: HEPN domain-containing protein [Verrucomicrobiota bacterium]|jgi:HEPN domain-containing protein